MEERILNALAGSPGKSAKEVARELGEATPIIMEHLLGLAASGALKQRTVGREQVFSVPRTASLPTPREITTGNWVQRVPAEPVGVAAPAVEPKAEPPSATVQELIDAGHLPPLQQTGRVLLVREPFTNIEFDHSYLDCVPKREWTLPPKPTLYDRIGGTIELEIGDSPIKARFQSVEQLHRFLTDLIENERAGQVPAEGKV